MKDEVFTSVNLNFAFLNFYEGTYFLASRLSWHITLLQYTYVVRLCLLKHLGSFVGVGSTVVGRLHG